MDRIISMTAFVQVVDSGSFAAAAKRLKVAPATVTHHVQSLENRLGIQLLNRTTRRVNLTEVGADFYKRASQILTDVEEAEHVASALQSTPRGTLRLNTSVTLARFMTPLIAEYTMIYPEVSFELIMSDRMVDMVEEGFDLALRVGALQDSSLIARRVGLGKMVVCASPAYLARRGTPQKPADLAGHNCLSYVNSFSDNRWHFSGAAGAEAIEVSGNLRSNSTEGLRAAALAGQGVCLLPLVSLADDLRAGRLVQLLAEFGTREAIIQAIYPASRHVSAKVRTFLDFVIKRLDQGPDWATQAPAPAQLEAPKIRAIERLSA